LCDSLECQASFNETYYHNTFTDRKKKPLIRGLVLSFDADVREFKTGIFLGLCDSLEYKKQQ